MFNSSPTSKAIWDFFNEKYGQMIAPIGLAKACAVVSAKTECRITANVFVVAPSGQFKSLTSFDIKGIFPKNYTVPIGSDFTIHYIAEHLKSKGINNRCLLINDGTLLLTSKSERTKDRLITGLAELIADKEYKYGERLKPLTIKAKISVVMNMTAEMYERNKRDLLGSTFLERFTTFFYFMPLREQQEWTKRERVKSEILWKNFAPSPRKKIKKNVIFGDFYANLGQISVDFAILSCKSYLRVYEQVKSLAIAHASLNGRNELCQDDVDFLMSLRQYLNNPSAPNESKIIQFANEGRSQKDICLLLNMSPSTYQPYISKVLRTAKLRGLLAI